MRLSGARAYYRPTPPKMPSGLAELIEGLTREVLKNNPTDIYGFCAGYLHQLLEIRDGPLHMTSLTLEEKIARAQVKVRQRAERRRHQIDFDLHPTQQTNSGIECNVISNKVDITSPAQIASVSDPVPIQIHHEQESSNSSEFEVLRAKDNSHAQNGEPQLENYDCKVINNTDSNYINNKAEVTKHESKYKSTLVELTSQKIDVNIVPEDNIDLHKPPNEMDMLDNEILSDKSVLAGDNGPVATGGHIATTHDENLLLEEFEKAKVERNSSGPPNSMLVSQLCVLIDSGEKIIEDNVQIKAATTRNIDDTNDVQNSPTQTDVTKTYVTESQSDNAPNIKEEKQIKSVNRNTQNIQQFSEDAELSTDNIVNEKDEDIVENKPIDISVRVSPVVELQDALNNSNTLEEITSDGDSLTLLTQECNNDKRKEHLNLKDDFLNSEESDKIIQITKCLNKTNTIDVVENPVVVSNNNEKKSYTATNLNERSQTSQDSSNIMDLETAAITIQKVFRTFLFKSRTSTFDEVTDEAIFLNEARKNTEDCNFANEGSLNERRPLGITRMDTVLQTVNEEKSLSLSTDDSSTLSSAATVIQAHVRGFLVRNTLNSNKTLSNSSLAASHSNEPSVTSLEMDNDQNKNKTVLNIHIVPDGGNYLSRDLITSLDLSLDSSPPSSINLHPLGYDKSERRKQLKREDAIQSISPPSNNSGKLSEDSVKELPVNDQDVKEDITEGISLDNFETANAENITLGSIVNSNKISVDVTDNRKSNIHPKSDSLSKMSFDEMDVVTPFMSNEDINPSDIKLMHSGEFHDAVLPTKVSRGDTSVASGE